MSGANASEETHIPCPFVYSTGRKCTGTIYRARAYGDGRNVRKYRLWCSERDDHAGAVSSFEGKDRMEFYPDQLPQGMEEKLRDLDLLS